MIWHLWFPRRVAKLHRQQASLKHGSVVTWDAQGLHVATEQAKLLGRWTDDVKRRENADVILLYQSDVMIQVLPKRVFAGQMASLRSHVDRVPTSWPR